MNYALKNSPALTSAEYMVIGVFDEEVFSPPIEAIDRQLQGLLTRLRSKLKENGDWVVQSEANEHSFMLIHCGKKVEFNPLQLKKRINDIITLLLKQHIASATLVIPKIQGFDASWQIRQMLLEVDARLYQLNDFKTANKKENTLTSLTFVSAEASQETISNAKAIAAGIRLTKTLANLPANHCTPTFLGQQALKLVKEHDAISTKVFDLNSIRELGMGALLAVSQGSAEPPCFIEISYNGAASDKPIVLVGKGITFDAGGLSLKPPPGMDEMKYDMSGAASVLGTIKACALLQLPVNVTGLIPSAENLPGGRAVKPGDIITTLSGQTVEIINTDAEGRLVLADALTYAERLNPKLVIDIATLTGAVIVALGSHLSGLMTTDEDLAQLLLDAGIESNDRCWRLPLEETFQDALDSPMADMINGNFDRSAGSITGACFLSRFTKKYRWAHLDIAGTAWISGKKRQATGRPVPLLIQLILSVMAGW